MAHNSKETSDTHFFGVGLWQPKNGWNIGAVLRSVGCFGGSFLAVSGTRFKETKADFRNMDTEFARKRIPVFIGIEDITQFIPHDTEVVVLERTETSEELPNFQHPRRAFYLFGPEDGSVPTEILQEKDISFKSVSIPSNGSLNLAAASYITLYDRQVKSGAYKVDLLKCPQCGSEHIKQATELTEQGETIYNCNRCGNKWAEYII